MAWLTLILVGCLVAPSPSEAPVAAKIREALAPQIQVHCQEARQAHLEILRIQGSPPEDGNLRVTIPTTKRLAGNIQVFLAYQPPGSPTYRRIGYAMVRVSWYDSVVVARTFLPRNASIDPEQVMIVWKDITRFTGEPLTAAAYRKARARGYLRLTRAVSAGAVLRKDDLAPALAADTGMPVLLEVRRPGLHITLSCTARQPGQEGALIRVYCPDTHQHYRARLLAEGKALWIQTLK